MHVSNFVWTTQPQDSNPSFASSRRVYTRELVNRLSDVIGSEIHEHACLGTIIGYGLCVSVAPLCGLIGSYCHFIEARDLRKLHTTWTIV